MKACIFDLDGTLLDSTGVWARVDEAFLARRGIQMPEGYVEAVAQMSFPEAAEYTIRRFGLADSVEALMAEWNAMVVEAYAGEVPMKPHAKEYLLKLKARGVRLAVATSLPEALYGPALRAHGIEGLFEVVCSTDEVGRSKAWPDVYLLAAQRLGVAPGECVVFEDVLVGVRSAKAAGMGVWAVYDAGSDGEWEEMCRVADGGMRGFGEGG